MSTPGRKTSDASTVRAVGRSTNVNKPLPSLPEKDDPRRLTRVIPQHDLVEDEFIPLRPLAALRAESSATRQRSSSVQTVFALGSATSQHLSPLADDAAEKRNPRASSVYTTATTVDGRLSFVTARENGSDDGLASAASSINLDMRRASTGFLSMDNLQAELVRSVDFFDRTPTPELKLAPSFEMAGGEVEVVGKGKSVVRPATIRFADEKKAYGQKPSVSSRYFLFLLLILTFT